MASTIKPIKHEVRIIWKKEKTLHLRLVNHLKLLLISFNNFKGYQQNY